MSRVWRRGYTLVELMLVLSIIAVLAALAIYGVRKYLAASKTSEAKDSVGGITRAVLIVYERERAQDQLLNEGDESIALSNVLCLSANPVPDTVPRGRKYQPSATPGQDFETGDGITGWQCLNHYSVGNPILYQYNYRHTNDIGDFVSTGPIGNVTPNLPGFEVAAVGDLDEDSANSVFARVGQVNTVSAQIVLQTHVFIHDEFE